MYLIAVFRSQTDTYSFANLLKSYGVSSSVVQTPRQAEVSCGLSVRFSENAKVMARELLRRRQFSSFVSFFEVRDFGNGKATVRRIYN